LEIVGPGEGGGGGGGVIFRVRGFVLKFPGWEGEKEVKRGWG